ncbi:hypothetical protein J9317_16695 [Metabacillus sp. KIGAM252]|uniref:Restriction endonuclease BglII n=1 Tax=Metabacillus flavus TaxID=2823519 RepID=A0ABS5LI61_9BACI|nr:hypothetical protein [Metabacillus flavus]MBS2970387.1 hypothetical protein [Metabacillus flavus]
MTMLLDSTGKAAWEARSSGNIHIAEEVYYRNANFFLDSNSSIKTDITQSLSSMLCPLDFRTKGVTRTGFYQKRIGAQKLNKTIKNQLKTNIPSVKFEVEFKEGVFFDTPRTGGFDFAIYDDHFNILNFWNYCFGRRAIHNGNDRWTEELNKRIDWKNIATTNSLDQLPIGTDLVTKKTCPIVIGEIQFANWGLLYYDILKAVHIEQFVDIDLLVYVTATGDLASYISTGTVNFNNAKEALEEMKNSIKVPIWLIGIDLT